MSNDEDIPTLTDLVGREDAFSMSDLGLDEENPATRKPEPYLGAADAEVEIPGLGVTAGDTESDFSFSEAELAGLDPFEVDPALEQTIRRILDEHSELALQEIKIAIRRHYRRS